MTKKLYILTIHYIRMGFKGKFPEKSQLEIGIYQLTEPKQDHKDITDFTLEHSIGTQLKHSQFVDAKTFYDDRNLKSIADELASKYEGYVMGGVPKVDYIAAFRITQLERILKEIFDK